MEKLVNAYNGNMEKVNVPKNKTRLIAKEYYIENESCFKMSDGNWHRINNGKIFYNIDSKTWQLGKGDSHFVLYNFESNNFKLGVTSNLKLPKLALYISGFGRESSYKFVSTPFQHLFNTETLKIITDSSIKLPFITLETVRKAPVFLSPRSLDTYIPIPSPMSNFKNIFGYKIPSVGRRTNYSRELQYNLEDSSAFVKEAKKEFEKSNFTTSSKYAEIFKNSFKNRSFGVEVETIEGVIPEKVLMSHGMVPLRDGSLDGGIEYTSIPFTSSKGLDSLESFYENVRYFCKTHQFCSMHVHVGGVKRDRLHLMTIYNLCVRLQEEMFNIVPPYKKDYRYFNSKSRAKDHCQSLRNLKLNLKDIESNSAKQKVEFQKLFTFLSEGSKETSDYNFDNKNYPKKGSSKWNLNSRYYWVNFIPYTFSNSGTIEFRIFNSPMDFSDTLNNILICMAILNYAETHGNVIRKGEEKITLEDVISNGLPSNISGQVLEYIALKSNLYMTDWIENNMYGEISRNNEFNESELVRISEKLNKSPELYFSGSITSPSADDLLWSPTLSADSFRISTDQLRASIDNRIENFTARSGTILRYNMNRSIGWNLAHTPRTFHVDMLSFLLTKNRSYYSAIPGNENQNVHNLYGDAVRQEEEELIERDLEVGSTRRRNGRTLI